MKAEITPLQKSLNIWAITLILWSMYRGFFKTELPIWFDEFIAKPLIFLVPIYYYIVKNEGHDFLKSIDLKNKNWRKGVLWGFIFGSIFFITGYLAQIIRGESLYMFSFSLSSIITTMQIILIAVATSFSEEALSRGFVLKRLYADSKNMLSAIFFSSILYFFIRVPILFSDPEIRGAQLLQIMITDLIFSVAVSFLYLQRKSLFVPIIIHVFYIVSIHFFLSLS